MALTTTELPRRRLLFRLFACLQGALALLAGLPAAVFLLTPLRPGTRASDWVKIGNLAEVTGAVPVPMRYRLRILDGYAETWQTGLVFVFRSRDRIEAHSSVCTHLGCNVDFDSRARLFECPCHGGRYRPDGSVAAGPPPRPLAAVPVKVENGEIFVAPLAPASKMKPA